MSASNPALILFDSDAISQLLIANAFQPLKILKKVYKVQSAVVEAVDKELRQNPKFFKTIAAHYEKFLKTEVLIQLDDRSYPAFANSPHAISSTIASLGTNYHTKIEEGEAYTHAASVILGVPVVSHDRNALRVMDKAGMRYVQPVLEVFDVILLAHQHGSMSSSDCDDVRKAIIAKPNEYIPPAFKHSNFSNGLPNFSPRLICSKSPAVGATPPLGLKLHIVTPIDT